MGVCMSRGGSAHAAVGAWLEGQAAECVYVSPMCQFGDCTG